MQKPEQRVGSWISFRPLLRLFVVHELSKASVEVSHSTLCEDRSLVNGIIQSLLWVIKSTVAAFKSAVFRQVSVCDCQLSNPTLVVSSSTKTKVFVKHGDADLNDEFSGRFVLTLAGSVWVEEVSNVPCPRGGGGGGC